MKEIRFARKKRQLKHASKELQRLLSIQKDSFTKEMKFLIIKIRRLIRELSRLCSTSEIKKALGATAFIFGLSFSQNVNAQSFARPIVNPFSINPQSYIVWPAFADLDNDGDMDLLVGGYYGRIDYFENEGLPEYPQFKLPELYPFGLDSVSSFVFLTVADLDNDEDIDIVFGDSSGSIQYIENIGTPSIPSFGPAVLKPFGLNTSFNEFAAPAFADLDGDGDLDLLVGEYYGNLKYCENVGTPEAPSFAPPVSNPFGLPGNMGLALPAFADLDNDGDMDLMLGGYEGVFNYFENTGSKSSPVFNTMQSNPFGLDSATYFAMPTFVDIDNDGDMDLFAGEYGYITGNLRYFENVSITGIEAPVLTSGFDIYPNPATEFLNIKTEKSIIDISILNTAGKIVSRIEYNGKPVNTASLNPGVYLLRIHFKDGKTGISKFFKE